MIPKIVHHVWPGDDPFKEKFHNFRFSWMKNHPDWTFQFWRLDNLPKKINPEVKEILLSKDFAITPKSDILRFEILRLYGGIYTDTDMECLKSFDNFKGLNLFAGYEDDEKTICPSLIGAVRGNYYIEEVLRQSLDNIKKYGISESNKNPHKITGVKPFTDVIKKYLNDNKINIFPKHYFYHIDYKNRDKLNETHPEAFAKHYWSGKDPDGWTKIIKF
jgi:mannosyltransferase OCH1-like enzyme